MRPALPLLLALLLGCLPTSGRLSGDDDDSAPPVDDDDSTAGDDDTPTDDDDTPVDDDDATQPTDAPGIGWLHDQENNMTATLGLMSGMWIRIAEGGEAGQDSLQPAFGIYAPGPNGWFEQGRGDDVLMQALGPSEVSVLLDQWHEVQEAQPDGNHPSGHTNEGSLPQLLKGNVLQAGADTGEMDLVISTPGFAPLETTLLVVPPDWCPNGEHDGGPWAPGSCS